MIRPGSHASPIVAESVVAADRKRQAPVQDVVGASVFVFILECQILHVASQPEQCEVGGDAQVEFVQLPVDEREPGIGRVAETP